MYQVDVVHFCITQFLHRIYPEGIRQLKDSSAEQRVLDLAPFSPLINRTYILPVHFFAPALPIVL